MLLCHLLRRQTSCQNKVIFVHNRRSRALFCLFCALSLCAHHERRFDYRLSEKRIKVSVAYDDNAVIFRQSIPDSV